MNQAASDKVFLSLTDVKDQLGVGRSTINGWRDALADRRLRAVAAIPSQGAL